MADPAPVTVNILCACGKKLGEQVLREALHPRLSGASKAICEVCAVKRHLAAVAKKETP